MSSPSVNAKPHHQKTPRIVFGDPDVEFLNRLGADPTAKLTQPILATQGNQVMSAVTDQQIELAAIFLSHQITQPDYLSVIKAIRQFRKGVPIFLIEADGKQAWSEEQLQELGVERTYSKTVSYSEIVREFFPPSMLLDLQSALKRSETNLHELGKEIQAEDSEFVSLPADQLLPNFKTFFDLYVRLDSGRFIKILKAGDSFSPERMKSYEERGLKEFWYRKTDEQDYLALTDRVVSRLNAMDAVAPVVKMGQTFAFGEQTRKYLKRFDKLSGEQVQFALSYVDRLNQLVGQLALAKQSDLIAQIMLDIPTHDHPIGVAALAAILARHAGLETDKSLRVMGVSALFHDIGLPHDLEDLVFKSESEMTPEETKIYRAHPVKGAQLLAGVRGIDPVATQMITLHHRRKDGSGFPNASGIGLSNISLPAEILAAADALSIFLTKEADHPGGMPNSGLRLDVSVFAGFSGDLVQTVKQTFKLDF